MDLVQKDMEVFGITHTEEEIKDMTKTQWKKNVKEVVSKKSFEFLKDENEKKVKPSKLILKNLE